MRVLINCISVKKRGGGVFQIATNFILNIVKSQSNELEWFYVVSEDLHKIFKQYQFSKASNYHVFPTQPDFSGTYLKVRKELKHIEKLINPDVVYSISSPSYFSFDAPEVMRFANAWVTNPNKYAYSKLNIKSKIRNKLYFIIQKRLMNKCSFFITQSETVKKGILSVVKTEPDNVKVVSNVLPAIYLNKRNELDFSKNTEDKIFIACVAVPQPHKNLDIIPNVLKYLRDKHNITNAYFLITLPENSSLFLQINHELRLLDLDDKIINHGYCTQEELIELYSNCEICFMPTLLETFSATLIEAMYFNLAIVTTNFCFNKDVVGDSALYYEPMNAEDAAKKLAIIIKDRYYMEDLKSKMSKYLERFKSFDNYMMETISFLKKVAEKTK